MVRAPCGVMHGKTSLVWHTNVGLMEVGGRRGGVEGGGWPWRWSEGACDILVVR